MLQRRLQRKDLARFIKQTFAIVDPGSEYKHNWHIDYIAEHLEAAYEREILRLIINIPPRNMKSICGTVAFPAWILGQNPSEQVLCGSYSSKLSVKHSVDCRVVMESLWYSALFPDVVIASDQNEKSKYQTTQRGHRIATSVGGTAIGEGGNFLIMDDPVNPKQAMSETERDTANDWMDQSWSSRRNDPKTSVEIVIMQRLHSRDPTGHLLQEAEDDWTHLVLPQEAESDTVITFPRSGRVVKRKEGDLLHEERIGQKEVASIKKRLGSYGYSAQQQQRPAPLGGGLVKLDWFRRYGARPGNNIIQKVSLSLDTAIKDKEINDPSVCGTFVETDAGHFLVDVWRDRVVFPDLKRITKGLILRCMDLFDQLPNEVLIEDKGSGQQLIQDLQRETNYAIIAMEPGGIDKVTRMANESPVIEAGQMWVPEEAPWLFDFEQEISNFPNAPNDDQVDMVSQYLKRQREGGDIFIG
jgi:predicted phage terminase large subunit-like protein